MWQKLTSIAKSLATFSHALAGYQTWEVGCNALAQVKKEQIYLLSYL